MEAFLAFGYLFEWIARFPDNAKFCTSCGRLGHAQDPFWEKDLCRQCHKEQSPYSVLHWGSHPDEGNDDCWTGQEFRTQAEAQADFDTGASFDIAYVELIGPDVHKIRKNPHGAQAQSSLLRYSKKEIRLNDAAERSEFAMQQGMAFGCQGYNEAMGYDSE